MRANDQTIKFEKYDEYYMGLAYTAINASNMS